MVALLLGRLVLERRDAIARARMEVAVRVAPDEGGNQMRSGVSQGHPPQSRRTQRPSEAIRGNHRQSRRTPRPTEAISTYPMSEWIVAAGMCSPLGCFGPATRGRGAVVSVCMQGRGASRAVWLHRTDDAEEGIELARLDAPHLMKGPIKGRQRHSSAIGRNQDAPSGHQRQSARALARHNAYCEPRASEVGEKGVAREPMLEHVDLAQPLERIGVLCPQVE